jgi:hypothetical protein
VISFPPRPSRSRFYTQNCYYRGRDGRPDLKNVAETAETLVEWLSGPEIVVNIQSNDHKVPGVISSPPRPSRSPIFIYRAVGTVVLT